MVELRSFNPNRDYDGESVTCPRCGDIFAFKGSIGEEFARSDGDGFEYTLCPRCRTVLKVERFQLPYFHASRVSPEEFNDSKCVSEEDHKKIMEMLKNE